MREGFCELFTKDVMVPVTAAAKGGDAKLRTAVEGGDFPDGFSPDLIPTTRPPPSTRASSRRPRTFAPRSARRA